MSVRNSNGRTERIERVGKLRIVRRNEAPLILFDIVHLTRHVVVTTDHINFILNEERFVAYSQLVHVVKRFPVFAVHIEQVHFSISVRVLSTDEKDFTW